MLSNHADLPNRLDDADGDTSAFTVTDRSDRAMLTKSPPKGPHSSARGPCHDRRYTPHHRSATRSVSLVLTLGRFPTNPIRFFDCRAGRRTNHVAASVSSPATGSASSLSPGPRRTLPDRLALTGRSTPSASS